MANTHSQVEFAVDDYGGTERIFKTFAEAAGFAVAVACSGREGISIDVLIYGEAGADWYGGDDAVARYREDPEASVFERIEITANPIGGVS